MRKLVLGDLPTLMGTPEKPSKIEWLMENGVESIEGVQIISLAQDMLPKNLLTYHERLFAMVEKFPFLKRISVALLCWPLTKSFNDTKEVTDVAATTFLDSDRYYYAVNIFNALQRLHDEFRRQAHLQVDISYHPMLTWPRIFFEQNSYARLQPAIKIQRTLWEMEVRRRLEFGKMTFDDENIPQVRIAIENEPTTSDQQANLLHSGNRLLSEMIYGLPYGWGVTADIQHLGMVLMCLQGLDYHPLNLLPASPLSLSRYLEKQKMGEGHKLIFPPFKSSGSHNPNLWTWEDQFACLRDVMGPITFHVAQVDDPLRHITPPIRWDDPIMPWPKILGLMQDLDEAKDNKIWYTVEIDGGHNFPEGYQHDLEAFLHLQEVFGK